MIVKITNFDENVVVPMKPDESDIRDFIDKNRP